MTALQRLRARKRGFTLVELMISLVMGLVVSLAAVALAGAATSSFHEEARLSVTEMAARMAAERLRQDLMRVSYMATGNIKVDPKVAHAASAAVPRAGRIASLDNLRGVRINFPNVPTPSAISASNGLNPDTLDLVGNFTTDESYGGTITKDAGACSGNHQLVTLNPNLDAAVRQLAQGPLGLAANVTAAFQPGAKGLVQVTDAGGCKHYAEVCDAREEGGLVKVSLGGMTIDGDYPVFYAHAGTSFGSIDAANDCGTSEPGPVTIAPISWIRWRVAPSTVVAEPALEGAKSDIVRTVCDWAGYANGICAGTAEVVAEYGVDLKLGVMVAKTDGTLAVYDLDSNAADISALTGGITPGIPGPQSVRSIRYRVATRAALPDRDRDLDSGAPFFLTRYNTGAGWARVRTIVSEVALTNQASMGYY